MVLEMLRAFFFIFMAEMGDKTQILAMVFATRFPIKKVFIGIGLGSLANHGIAVLLGYYLSNVIPVSWLQIIAGVCFIGFSLWSLQTEEEEEIQEETQKLGPVWTVALAFFLGELGDKTQLTAITLATEATYPGFILVGTVFGMICTGAVGIWVGSKVGDKVPEMAMKMVSSGLFLFFGITKLFQSIPRTYVQSFSFIIFLIAIALLYGWRFYLLLQNQRQKKSTLYQKTAQALYESTRQIRENMNNLCLGENTCGHCQGDHCLVGYMKQLSEYAMEHGQYYNIDMPLPVQCTEKSFERELVIESYAQVLYFLAQSAEGAKEDFILHRIRQALEMILFENPISYEGEIDQYLTIIKEKNEELAKTILEKMDKQEK
ncbi:MAG: TMEM165/GDT1 family protein [Epulopiscium sp.]|nr:TMEM165/GDT1 family protein [Candidatus Epulonipiscium sp.]